MVARLQRRVKQAHEAMRAVGGQVVILGKRGHAEVVGLTGQVAEPTVVIERAEDLAQIDFARPIHFLSQTTQSIALFEELGAEMRRRAADPAQVRLDDTICRQVSGREAHLAQFAARFDARRVRLRPQILERQGPLRGVPPGQPPLPQHRGARGAGPGMVRGSAVGGHLRRHLDPQMAHAAGRGGDPCDGTRKRMNRPLRNRPPLPAGHPTEYTTRKISNL